MLDVLNDCIATYSVEKYMTTPELIDALVSAAYDAREYLDFSNVERRGRWGTPTAAAFRVALKNAFEAAVAHNHRLRGE